LTSELERIKILEGKITQIVEQFSRLSQENARLKDELKNLKADKKELEERLRKLGSLEDELKRCRKKRRGQDPDRSPDHSDGKAGCMKEKIIEIEILEINTGSASKEKKTSDISAS